MGAAGLLPMRMARDLTAHAAAQPGASGALQRVLERIDALNSQDPRTIEVRAFERPGWGPLPASEETTPTPRP